MNCSQITIKTVDASFMFINIVLTRYKLNPICPICRKTILSKDKKLSVKNILINIVIL